MKDKELNLLKYMYKNQETRFNASKYSDNISRRTICRILKKLENSGFITKTGRGMYLLSKKGVLMSESGFVTSDNKSMKKQPREVRGHGFRFNIKLPKIKDWSDREFVIKSKGLIHKKIAGGISVRMLGHTVKMYDKTLDVYFGRGWSAYSVTAIGSWEKALVELRKILREFRSIFNLGVLRFSWKVSKQHFSLINNILAKDYRERGDKLNVYNEDGELWLNIDNSFNLDELETLHGKTAKDDNKIVQKDFNDLKEKGWDREFIISSIGQLTSNMQYYGENMVAHVAVMKKIDAGLKEDSIIRKEMLNIFKKINKKL